jgi:hypothetical protein
VAEQIGLFVIDSCFNFDQNKCDNPAFTGRQDRNSHRLGQSRRTLFDAAWLIQGPEISVQSVPIGWTEQIWQGCDFQKKRDSQRLPIISGHPRHMWNPARVSRSFNSVHFDLQETIYN